MPRQLNCHDIQKGSFQNKLIMILVKWALCRESLIAWWLLIGIRPSTTTISISLWLAQISYNQHRFAQCHQTNTCHGMETISLSLALLGVNARSLVDSPHNMLQGLDASLQWRYNGCDGVWNNQPHDCLHNRLFRRRSKKTSKLRVTGLRVGNSPLAGEFPTLMSSNAENFPFDDVIMVFVVNLDSRRTVRWNELSWHSCDLTVMGYLGRDSNHFLFNGEFESALSAWHNDKYQCNRLRRMRS